MAVNTYYKTSVDVTMTLTNGSGDSLAVLGLMDGVTLDGLRAKAGTSVPRADVVIRDGRGVILTVRQGQQEPTTVKFDVLLPGMTSATKGLVRDFLAYENAYSAAVGTYSSAAGCPRTVSIAFAIEGTDHGDVDETITVTHIAPTWSFATSMDGNKLSISGPCYGTVVHA